MTFSRCRNYGKDGRNVGVNFSSLTLVSTSDTHVLLTEKSAQRSEDQMSRKQESKIAFVTLGSLLWLLNTTLNLMTLFVLVLHVLRKVFGFIFF